MTTFITETLQGKIEYSVLGQGKVILIVHGGHVNCRETIFQKGLAANKYCFITPSRPGYGKTPLTGFNKTPAAAADLLVALLDELNIPTVIVIGISAGGLTALEMAARYPGRVVKLVLLSALTKKWFVPTDTLYLQSKKAFAPKVEPFTWAVYRLLLRTIPAIMIRLMFRNVSKHRPVAFTREELMEVKKLTLAMRSGDGFHNDLDQDIEQETLSKIECPTLIVHSGNDNAVDLSHAQHGALNIKRSELFVFNNRWGHLLWIGEEYGPALTVLQDYLDA